MGTTLAERIIPALKEADGPLTDAQLAAALKVVRQPVNQTCRTLEQHGVLTRQKLVGSNIVNVLTGVPLPAKPQPAESSGQLLAEDEVKIAVRDHLQGQGYVVKVAWGHEPGIDIDAIRPGDHLLIEAKGEAASHPQQANYFVGALGELVQRFAERRQPLPVAEEVKTEDIERLADDLASAVEELLNSSLDVKGVWA